MSDRRSPRRYVPSQRRNSLIASAAVLTSGTARHLKHTDNEPWVEQAWRFYDTIGELRFGANWYSNALSRINIMAAAPPLRQGDDPVAIDLEGEANSGEVWYTDAQRRAVELVEYIAGGVHGQGQMMGAFGLYLSLVGLAYLVAEPDPDDPFDDSYQTWMVCSNEEVRTSISGELELRVAPTLWRPIHPNALVVKVWTQHPRHPWQPDAPTRAVLGVLNEIQLLQAHIDSSARSRLAGAGIVLMPDEASFPSTAPSGADPGELDGSDEEDLTETLVRVSSIAINDHESPAARVPIFVSMPGEYVDKVKHLRFDTAFDDRALDLLDKAIKRLALGLDLPPEVLTGVGGMNHWSAWQVEETALTLHIEPLAETVCHALTVGYLRTALEMEGFDPDEAIVWFDSSDLRTRPDRSASAREAWDRQTISTSAMLREVGLSEDDAISEEERRERILLDTAAKIPAMAPAILASLGYLSPELAATAPAEAPAPAPVQTPTEEPTKPQGAPERPENPPEASSTAIDPLVAACDQAVLRTLERAGGKLLSAADATKSSHNLREVPATERHLWSETLNVMSVDRLLEGAWGTVPDICARYGYDSELVTALLQLHTAQLITARQPHSYDGLYSTLAQQLAARPAH